MISLAKTALKYDWEVSEEDTQYSTHGVHRYSGKFIPQVARNAIEIISKKDDLVLDVYAGSGTTLLECIFLERHSIGIDLSPLAVLISKVKTTPINKNYLHEWRVDFQSTIEELSEGELQEQLPLNRNSRKNEILSLMQIDSRLTDPWYSKWFQPHVLRELVWVDLNIKKIKDEDFRDLALVALSDILRKSSNAHSGYPNVMFDKNKKTVGSIIKKYLKRLSDIVGSVGEFSEKVEKKYLPKIIEGNNTDLQIKPESIDAIVTHPPYIGSVPYAEYGVLSLTWLNKCPKELDSVLTGGQRQRKNVVERFMNDYAKMFAEAHRVLKDNKYMFILVGDPTVKGSKIDLTEASIEYAKLAGLRLDSKLTRKGVNRRANLMGEESMLFFKK